MAGYNIDDGMNGRNASIETAISVDDFFLIKRKLRSQNLTGGMRKCSYNLSQISNAKIRRWDL
jgi:hypothetical protein